MLLRSTLFAVFALPTLISGRLVRRPDDHDYRLKTLPRAVSGDALTRRTPGSLRVVENSGVCGRVILFVMHPSPLSCSLFLQKLRRVSIRLRDTVI